MKTVSFVWLLLLFAAPGTFAQGYPSRPIEVVVHTGAGGGNDRVARVFVDILQREKLVTQPMTVLNKVGGAGSVAFNYIKSKGGDPHVILSGLGSTFVTASLRPELGVSLDLLTPLALLARDPQAVMVSADAPWKTFKEFVEAGKREPLVASYASPTGSGRMLLWMLEKETGVQRFKTVSMKSGSDAIMAVMGGHTQVSTENIAEGLPLVEAKKVRVLAVTSGARMAIVPDVPTMKELGYNIHFGSSRGFGMPAGAPKEAVAHMEGVIEKVYHSPAWKTFAQQSHYENVWMGSAAYAKYLRERRVVAEEFLKAIGVIK
jgi:putative tricarboxylic transport membrane protein